MIGDYKITIGLEIHAELKTQTKMFCGCLNRPDEKNPNTNICPVCMGYPGTLPVINKSAVKKVFLVGSALGSTLAAFTEFDRKNYFYPDIPKGYQISQYKYPLVSGGELAGVKLTRIHLEEDTARSSHDTPGVSLVDYNRAGVPLMELVTEPVIHSASEVMAFAQELQLLLQYLGVSDANMEKGEMRVEVNISIAKDVKDDPWRDSGQRSFLTSLGTKVEVKNINSFKAAAKAVEYEFERQKVLLESGEKVIQETRGFDENKGITFSQRSKESAHDYRYFPEPDLPKLVISEIPEFATEKLKSELPELPWQKRQRYERDLGLKKDDIEVYINNPKVAGFFEKATGDVTDKNILQTFSNYIISDLLGLSKSFGVGDFDFGKVTPKNFNKLMVMQKSGEVSSRGTKDILKIMFESGGEAEQIAKEKNLIQKNDPIELQKIMQKIIDENPSVVTDYKSGKESVLQFFVGQGMKESKGSGNPEVLKKIALELLK
jgi:aspartyl-tRNA(Asn)/glutamyl-tRNA(Gln) amidotransferase subunit B